MLLQKIKTIPHLLLFRRASARKLIEADVRRWVEIHDSSKSARPVEKNLIWLFDAHPEFRNLFYFRLGMYSRLKGRVLIFLARFFCPIVDSFRFGIPSIGPGFFVEHGYDTIIGAEKIGENCWINSGVTLGYRDERGVPVIGNNVYIGAGAKVLGPITIGDNVIIGANAVVLRDVPPNCTVGGVPARIIKRDGKRVKEFLPASRAVASES